MSDNINGKVHENDEGTYRLLGRLPGSIDKLLRSNVNEMEETPTLKKIDRVGSSINEIRNTLVPRQVKNLE